MNDQQTLGLARQATANHIVAQVRELQILTERAVLAPKYSWEIQDGLAGASKKLEEALEALRAAL